MSQHPNAKLTPKGRETLVSRIESGLGVAEVARQSQSYTQGKHLSLPHDEFCTEHLDMRIPCRTSTGNS